MAADKAQRNWLGILMVLLALVLGIFCIFSISSLCGCGGEGSDSNHENPESGGPGQVPDKVPIEVPADCWGQLSLARIAADGALKPKIRAILDGGGGVHITCLHRGGSDGEYQLGYLFWSWQNSQNPVDQEPEPVANIDNCQALALTLTRDNWPVVAYRGGTPRGCSEEDAPLESDAIISLREKDAAWSSWTGAEGVAESGSFVGLAGTEVSVAADSKGYIHLSYQLFSENCQDKSVSADLYYLKKHRSALGASVSAERVEEDQDGGCHCLGDHCTIILDGAENPVIFHFAEFSDQTKGLRIARRQSGGTWHSEWIEQGCEVGCISCARDTETGCMGVAYYVKGSVVHDSDSRHYLRYAASADERISPWQIMTVDDHEACGDYCSLDFDSQGCPAIVYYEIMERYIGYPLKNLKFAYFKNGSWDREVIASQGDIGLYNSIRLDDDNRAFVCSYSNTDETVYLFYRDLAQRYDSGESSE